MSTEQRQKAEPYGLHLTLEGEVEWRDVAPILDELQAHPNLLGTTVQRNAFRIAAGGPGFDILPILFYATCTALIYETVRDLIYPKLKQLFYDLYRKLPGQTGTGKVYPMGFGLVDGSLSVVYRLPPGLDDVAFEDAVRSVSTHFAALRGRDDASLMFTYNAEKRSWEENVEASEFETWLARDLKAQGAADERRGLDSQPSDSVE